MVRLMKIIVVVVLLTAINMFNTFSANIIYSGGESIGPGDMISNDVFEHDGVFYRKGEAKGKFSLSGYCACKKCSSGTGYTYSGAKVRENHTIAADKKVLPIGTMIILEEAVGKDGTKYDGVYKVEDIGGGVKNNHIDIYRPTHDLACLVTQYGRCYGNVYIAVPINNKTNIIYGGK